MATRSTLTKSQLETLRRRLEEERKRILQVLRSSSETESLDDARSELEETAQRATEWTQQRGVAERESALLDEVDRALGRIGAGTYGISEKSGAPIPYDRLNAMPWARHGADE
jgi:DnaK suppressor protein